MNKEIISSITEAFSTQPTTFFANPDSKVPTTPVKIELELLTTGTPENGFAEWYYVGYNFEGKKIFQYIARSVNVNYQP